MLIVSLVVGGLYFVPTANAQSANSADAGLIQQLMQIIASLQKQIMAILQQRGATPTANSVPSGWQTYYDEGLSFSVQHPADYTISRLLKTTYSNGKSWYQVRITDPLGKASLLIEANPDGYGPIFANEQLTVEKTIDGGLKIIGTELIPLTENNNGTRKVVTVNSIENYDWTISYPNDVSQRGYVQSREFDATLKKMLESFKFPK